MARLRVALALFLLALATAPIASAAAESAPKLVGVGGECDAALVHVGCTHWSAPPPGNCAFYWGLTDRCIIY